MHVSFFYFGAKCFRKLTSDQCRRLYCCLAMVAILKTSPFCLCYREDYQEIVVVDGGYKEDQRLYGD